MSFGPLLSLVVLAGVTAGLISQVESAAAAAIATFTLVLAIALAWGDGRWGSRCAWCAVGAVALTAGAFARDAALAPVPSWIVDAVEPIRLDGRLRRDASIVESGVRLELDDVWVHGPGDSRDSVDQLQVLTIVNGALATGSVGEWTAGRRVSMPVRLRVPSVVRNPGSPSPRWQRLTRPFDLVGTVKSAALVQVERGTAWQEAAAGVRRHVRAVAAQWLVPLGGDSAAVVTAILIGDRAGLDESVTRRLQVAGTFHVIAISGGNVAILTALCLFVFRLFMRRDQIPVVLTLVTVVAYGLVVGRDASVVRAVIAATLYLGLRLTGVVPQPTHVLTLTALISMVADPMVVLDVGAWLSFGATLGLITILPRLMGDTPPGPHRNWVTALRVVNSLFLATVAAEIVILPVAASVFMRVGVAGLLLNFVAIPAMVLAQLSGLLLIVLGSWPWLQGPASVLALTAHEATRALTGSAGLVDVVPWVSWRVPPPPVVLTMGYYAVVVLALAWRGRRWVKRGAVGAAMVCACLIVTAPWAPWQRPAPGWVRVTMIDVGQGEAIVVQFATGHVLLVDAGGSAGTFDVGGRVVTPALWALGIRKINWLAVTHADVDHAGGAPRVAGDLSPVEIWEGVPVPAHPLMGELRRVAQTKGAAWRRLQTGHQVELDNAVIDVLHPPIPDWERRDVRNDDSIVLRLRVGQVEVLLTGDAGPEFELPFTRGEPSPPIRVLKVGHHGSRTSSADQFLDRYAPVIALVSAGQGNLFGHPSPVVMARMARRGIDVFRTDRDGAVVIETDGREAHVRTVTGRSLVVTTVSPAATRPPSLR